jgi:hypothetical protein
MNTPRLSYEEYVDARTVVRPPKNADEERIAAFYADHMPAFDDLVRYYISVYTEDFTTVSSEELTKLWRFFLTGRLMKHFAENGLAEYRAALDAEPLRAVRNSHHFTLEAVLENPMRRQCDNLLLFLFEKMDTCERLVSTLLEGDDPANWLRRNSGSLELFKTSQDSVRAQLEAKITQVMLLHPLNQMFA